MYPPIPARAHLLLVPWPASKTPHQVCTFDSLLPSRLQVLAHPWFLDLDDEVPQTPRADGLAANADLAATVVQRLQRFGTYGRLKQVALRGIAGIALSVAGKYASLQRSWLADSVPCATMPTASSSVTPAHWQSNQWCRAHHVQATCSAVYALCGAITTSILNSCRLQTGGLRVCKLH